MKIAILASGNGTNLQAIIDQLHLDSVVQISIVISDRPKAYALHRAKIASIPTAIVQLKHFPDRNSFDSKISEIIDSYQVYLIVLAGYMKIFQPQFIQKYRYKIINIHPSLLPKFPGRHSVSDALKCGEKVTGTTIHFVNEGIDTGQIIAQSSVPILDSDNELSLHNRIQQEEHKLYPQVIKQFAKNLILPDNK